MIGKRVPKPKGKVKIKWSPKFAYAIGLLVTDGSLSKNGRHIILVSKDIEQLQNFMRALEIKVLIGKTSSGYDGKTVTRVQFGDVLFYQFLLNIGLMSNKTKIIGEVRVPQKYFFDFLRGCLDGDGCTYSYFDPRWRSSFMFYTTFVSASEEHIKWIREKIFRALSIQGHLNCAKRKGFVYQLKYAKKDSLLLLRRMYYNQKVLCLSRKRLKIEKMLSIVGERL